MTAQTQTDDEPAAEVTHSELHDSDEWELYADVRVRISNPHGDDYAKVTTHKFGPKHDGLTDNPDMVHSTTKYWWVDDYPSDGDSPFHDSSMTWEPSTDTDDSDAILAGCEAIATYDPAAEVEALLHELHPRTAEKLEGK
jgi:hypothetical protein